MSEGILGIHHVTAICGDPKQNLAFYRDLLGMRLVKKTVNYDDPGSYHLYYGDSVGHPGTLLTFFAHPGGREGRPGTGQATAVALAVPKGSLSYWAERLSSATIQNKTEDRLGELVLCFKDYDGMEVELIESEHAGTKPESGEVPVDQAIMGIHSVTLCLEGFESTAKLIHERMGYRAGEHSENRFRYVKAQAHIGGAIDLFCCPYAERGRVAVGSIHHVAFRVENDQKQRLWRISLAGDHYNVSPIIDRNYFHSLYFREPGGVLFEIATDVPGFATDEPLDNLGTTLTLPPQYESHRNQIESVLPAL